MQVIFLFLATVLLADTTQMTVDLHAHPFMKQGMGFVFKGKFDGPLRAKNWKTLFGSAINPEALEKSQDQIVVATLYVHPLLKWFPRHAIRQQLALAEDFVATHPRWVIARDAGQARDAVASGKRVLVLALERASKVLESEADLHEFIDERGIRIVTLLHLDDDRYGGVAFMSGFKSIFSPWAWLKSLFHPKRDGRTRINPRGLTKEGRALLAALIEHKVWVDLSHASDQSARDASDILEAAGLPLLYTHTTVRNYLGSERGISPGQLQRVRDSNGIVGILPSEEMLAHTKVAARFCPLGCSCKGSVAALATQYAELVEVLGAPNVMLGSDFNGGIDHLKPACRTGTELDGPKGFWNMGQTGKLWDALENSGAPVPRDRSAMVDTFIDKWERVGHR